MDFREFGRQVAMMKQAGSDYTKAVRRLARGVVKGKTPTGWLGRFWAGMTSLPTGQKALRLAKEAPKRIKKTTLARRFGERAADALTTKRPSGRITREPWPMP